MSDLISRQAAIDALDKRFDSIPMEQTTEILLLRKDLRNLPSAQPEIIRCKDCKWKNNHNCTRAVEVWIDDNKYCAWAERRTE